MLNATIQFSTLIITKFEDNNAKNKLCSNESYSLYLQKVKSQKIRLKIVRNNSFVDINIMKSRFSQIIKLILANPKLRQIKKAFVIGIKPGI